MGQVVVNSGKKRGGRRSVVYRDAKGKTWSATVIGDGSVSGKKLQLEDPPRSVIDNVPLATSYKGTTAAYFNNWPRY